MIVLTYQYDYLFPNKVTHMSPFKSNIAGKREDSVSKSTFELKPIEKNYNSIIGVFNVCLRVKHFARTQIKTYAHYRWLWKNL
jgi:hypothetical protein